MRRLALAAVALAIAMRRGCAMFRREPLEVPPGHQAVMGGVVVAGFGAPPHVVLEIAREDGCLPARAPR